MRECVDLGIRYVWMHRSFGGGSVSASATAYGREHGVKMIPGGCPLMFDPVGDGGHKGDEVLLHAHWRGAQAGLIAKFPVFTLTTPTLRMSSAVAYLRRRFSNGNSDS